MATPSFEKLTVLDFSRYLPGGYATQPLADWGANVIKVEDTGMGDFARHENPTLHGISYYITALGRNKKSVSFNLKDPEVVELFLKLAEESDVIVESFRPGVTKKLGIDYESIRARNPRIIYVSISAFGQFDPRSLQAKHDINMQASSGYLAVNHGSTSPLHFVDLSAAMVANQAILAALFNREHTGEGSYIDISMYDCFLWWNSLLDARYDFNRGQLKREDVIYPVPAYNVYETADGGKVAVGSLEDKFWNNVCDTTGASDATRAAKLQKRWEAPEAFAEMEAIFKSRTTDEWRVWTEENDVCSAVVIDKDEALKEIVSQEPNTMNYVDFPDVGRVLQTNIPHHIAQMPVDIAGFKQPSRLGQDTADVLRSLGVGDEQLQALADRGAVKLDTPVDWSVPDINPVAP